MFQNVKSQNIKNTATQSFKKPMALRAIAQKAHGGFAAIAAGQNVQQNAPIAYGNCDCISFYCVKTRHFIYIFIK